MKKYKVIDVSEKQLEEMIKKEPDLIEDGLRYIDHQRKAGRGPLDVLFVDSGNALVISELKVIEDEGMLIQGIDYYDFVTSNIDGFARAYKDRKIDPMQNPRLFLIAPSFSIQLLNRCKWIDIPISLFTFQCIVLQDKPEEIIPVFIEVTVPSRRQPVEVYTKEDKLNYITDSKAKKIAKEFIEEIKKWDEKVSIDAIKYALSIKVAGRVLAYLEPRRKYFLISTYDTDDEWKSFTVKSEEDLKDVRIPVRSNYEKFK